MVTPNVAACHSVGVLRTGWFCVGVLRWSMVGIALECCAGVLRWSVALEYGGYCVGVLRCSIAYNDIPYLKGGKHSVNRNRVMCPYLGWLDF